MTRVAAMVVAVLLGVAGARVARAQDAPPTNPPTKDSPWTVGVSSADQQIAQELQLRGNVEFAQARFREAIEIYKQALEHWDHPAIRYNLALSYNGLGEAVEALKNLERALAYGEAPLGHELYVQGLNYRENLSARTARIKVICNEPGADVSLDGKHIFVAPGELEDVVLAGEHQVVASKPGFLTASERLMSPAGTVNVHEVHLVVLPESTPMVRRWPTWKPWVVGGAGVLTVAVGGVLYLLASDNFAQYDQNIASNCPSGCPSGIPYNHERSLGYAEQGAGGWMLGLGAAAIIAGIAGLLLDEPRAAVDHVVATPLSGGAAVSVGWSF